MREKNTAHLKKLKGKLLRYFLAGFIDGEGSFDVSFAYFPEMKGKIKVNPKFQVYQDESGIGILKLLREVFHTGRIYKEPGSNVYVFSIDGVRSNVEKVVPFFRRYPLATKREQFEKFEKILKILSERTWMTKEKLLKIIDLAYSMNAKKGKESKYSKEELIEIVERNFSQS